MVPLCDLLDQWFGTMWRKRIGTNRRHKRSRRPMMTMRLDAGAVTAEFAVVLPAVILVATVLMGLARTVVVAMACQDAAAVAVREIVVAGDGADPIGAAMAVAGSEISVDVGAENGKIVTVTVSCPVIPDPMGVLPTRVSAVAAGIVQ